MVIFEMKCKKLYIKNARNKNYFHLRERERERERETDRQTDEERKIHCKNLLLIEEL